ncbi:hypothetical protein OCE40_15030 [Bacillus toyonensis]|uniref:hypothetical protein n=1 Tax=Bacillus toyonensis TaxID=155322 RepID=UPI001039692D|nr:hypothetical protein [Bacillus toyonensis]MCU5303199.1 hypothetical protein [Bacillus toyonensis]TBX46484.1 hypothetical protein E0M44_16335 [Bacillus toyonensis]
MGVIIFMLVMVTSVVIVLLYLLVLFIIKKPKIAIRLEIIGYCLLAISLGWLIVFNMTVDIANETDKSHLNEKLKLIWIYNGDISSYLVTKDSQRLLEQQSLLTKIWNEIEPRSENFKKQEELVKIINIVLFILSTLFIACGRVGELIERCSNNKKTVRKKRYQKRHWRSITVKQRGLRMKHVRKSNKKD